MTYEHPTHQAQAKTAKAAAATAKKRPAKKKRSGLRVHRNIRPVFLLLLIPMGIGIATAALIVTGLYRNNLADFGSKRLETAQWQQASQAMLAQQPKYERKFAYYKVKDGQTLPVLAEYFGVSEAKLRAMNPGIIATGTTIKVPPLEKPYVANAQPNGLLGLAVVTESMGMVRLQHKHRVGLPIVTTIPELAAFLAPYGVIEQTGPKTYRLNKGLSLDGDFRLDMTPATVTRLELLSQPGTVTCLCFDQAGALLQDVEVTSYDKRTGKPDTDIKDNRSFVRMKNGRLDIIDSRFSYLGNAIEDTGNKAKGIRDPFNDEGGMYGVSWRISSDTLGTNLTTGWVEGSRFEHNHFGTYTFGASGMVWRDSYFGYNDIYGLDPHDDSNNAIIEGNVFEHNGKHGFIVSKRCNYNIIRNNISMGNKLHGYMLHQDSAYNLMENNIAYGNQDNYVIYESNYNTVRNNKSYLPNAAHIRVNKSSNNTFVMGNELTGGPRGIFLYDKVRNTYIAGNRITQVNKSLMTNGTTGTLFANNTIDGLHYDIDPPDNDSMIFGPNTVDSRKAPIPSMANVYRAYKND